MTGLFQIFDRYRTLTRSKSTQKKVANSSNGEPAQGAGRDPSCIPFAYNMFQDESAQRRATLGGGHGHMTQPEVPREPRRSSIDNSEVMLAKPLANSQPAGEPKPQPARISLDSRPKPRLSFYFREDAPVSDTSIAVVKGIPGAVAKEIPAAVAKEPPRNSFSGLLQRRNSDPTVVASRLSVDGKTPGKEDKEKKSRDFRGMFKGSFLRKESKVNSQESPGASFDRKDGEQLKVFSEVPVKEKEGLELSVDLSGLDGLAGDNREKNYSRFGESPKGWIESRDGSTPRLTVELKEGPQLTWKDDQRGPVDDLPRLSSIQDPGRYIVQKGNVPTPIDFKESLKAIDSKDLRKEQRDRARSVDGRDPPSVSLDAKAAASRISVDGRPTPQQFLPTPRLSVDGRDTHHQGAGHHGDVRNANRSSETSTTVSPRRDNSRAVSPRRDGNRENDMEGTRWKASSVVARLMGLEDLPNLDVATPAPTAMSPSTECKSPQKRFYYIHPEESPHPLSDDSVYQADEGLAPQRKEKLRTTFHTPGWQDVDILSTPPNLNLNLDFSFSHKDLESRGHHTPASPKQLPMSPKHHMIESMPQVLKHPIEQKSSSEGLLYGDMDQRLRQLGLKNSIQERKTLKQILEAMHLKGLLHPPRHMDNDGKHNFSRQVQSESVAKSLFHDTKDRISHPAASLKTDLFDLDYKDIPKYISAHKTKGFEESGQEYDGSKSPSRGRIFSGEASIVVMKPLNVKPASKLTTLKPSPNLPQSKEVESMAVRGSCVSRKLVTAATPPTTLEKEDGITISTGISTKSETVAGTIKHRPRSRSVEPRKQNRVEELPATVRLRRERIAARTAKATSEGADIYLRDSSKVTRSISPPAAKRPVKSAPPARSAFGSSISRTGDGKTRPKVTKDKEEIKSTTQVTRRTKSSRELLKERPAVEQEAPKVLSRSRSDSKLVASYVDRAASPERWNKSKGPAEVAVLRSKRSIGRTGRDSNERSNLPLRVDVESVGVSDRLKQKIHLEGHNQWESTANSYSEIQDVLLDRSQNDPLPIVVMSPPFSLPESRRSKITRHTAEKPPDGLDDGHKSKAEDTIHRTQSDPMDYRGYGRSDVPFARGSQTDELASNAGVGTGKSSELSTPRGISAKKLQKDTEDESRRLAEGAEQPSPVSVLDHIHFLEEECTPSPNSERPGSVSLQDGISLPESEWGQELLKLHIPQPADPSTPVPALTGDPLKDIICPIVRTLDLDDQESYLNKPTLEIQVPYVSDLSTAPATSSVPSSLKTKEDERAYVSHIMGASGVTGEANAPSKWLTSGHIMSTDFFDQLEEHLELRESARKQNVYLSGEERTEYLKEALDRRLLFDSVNNILERKLQPYLNPQPWASQNLQKKPTGVKLVQEVLEELQEIHTRALDDDTLYTILQKDFTQRGEKWVDFSVEVGEIGVEIEEMIFDEMMDAAVQELMDECTDKLRSSQQARRDVSSY